MAKQAGIWAWGQGCLLTSDATWVLPWGLTLRPPRDSKESLAYGVLHLMTPVVWVLSLGEPALVSLLLCFWSCL